MSVDIHESNDIEWKRAPGDSDKIYASARLTKSSKRCMSSMIRPSFAAISCLVGNAHALFSCAPVISSWSTRWVDDAKRPALHVWQRTPDSNRRVQARNANRQISKTIIFIKSTHFTNVEYVARQFVRCGCPFLTKNLLCGAAKWVFSAWNWIISELF